MKKIICAVAILLITATQTFAQSAVSGEVYFGKFFDSHSRSAPPSNSGDAQYVSGVKLFKNFEFFNRKVTPKLNLETLMDGQNSNQSFKPSSIRYDFGINFQIYEGLSVEVSRMCWHTIDNGKTDYRAWRKTEDYYLVMMKYEWE